MLEPMNAVYPVICSQDVAAGRDFYARLLGAEVVFDAGWYVQLVDRTNPAAQLGIVERDHETVPERFRVAAAGVLVSVEVDAVDPIYERATADGLEILLSLRDEDFGQRHFITVDPDGLAVDVIQLIPHAAEYDAAYAASPVDAPVG